QHPDFASHTSFQYLAHRPWDMPAGRWTWRQSWQDLLFAHWPVPAEVIRPLVPAALNVQEFDGASWIGIVPYRMAGVMRRPLPDMPWVSAFPELNVRVYVEAGGKPGVWFLSLDATNPLVVATARALFHVPYHHAAISVESSGEAFQYRSRRFAGNARKGMDAVFEAEYRPVSDVYAAQPGTLEHFLTERYCLYARSPGGTLYRTEVHHRQWPLQRAEAVVKHNTVAAAGGVLVSGPPSLLHFSRRIDVVVWPGTKA
ncbi:MAG TPA: DUF2071 domain-containing protein, partial [Promineifilum sp.]